jgi:hypothetical protein
MSFTKCWFNSVLKIVDILIDRTLVFLAAYSEPNRTQTPP